MKIAHFKLDSTLEFDDERMTSWLIKHPQTYYEFVQELLSQSQGEIGNFVLSDGNKTLKFDSVVQAIVGPFDISINSKKISTMVSKKLLKLAVEDDYYLKFKELSKMLNNYLLELLDALSLPVEIDEFQEDNLVKLATIKPKESHSFYENLTSYISLILNLTHPKLIVLVDIKPYMSFEQFEQFVQFLMYEDVYVLFVDLLKQEKVLTWAKTYFLDSDNCEFVYPKGVNICR